MLIVDPMKRLTLDQVRDHQFLNEFRIPKVLPVSILTTNLPKNFLEQYPRGRSSLATQFVKNPEKQETKLSKGISERIISTLFNSFSETTNEHKHLAKQLFHFFLQCET